MAHSFEVCAAFNPTLLYQYLLRADDVDALLCLQGSLACEVEDEAISVIKFLKVLEGCSIFDEADCNAFGVFLYAFECFFGKLEPGAEAQDVVLGRYADKLPVCCQGEVVFRSNNRV